LITLTFLEARTSESLRQARKRQPLPWWLGCLVSLWWTAWTMFARRSVRLAVINQAVDRSLFRLV